MRVLTDPFLRERLGPLERHGPMPDPDDLGAIDVVAHLARPSRPLRSRLVGRPCTAIPLVVVPRGLGNAAAAFATGDVVEMTVGDRVDVGGCSISAVPARHWISPGAPRAEPIGYLIDGGRSVYFAGDTGPLPELERPRRGGGRGPAPGLDVGSASRPGSSGPTVGG